MLDYLSPPTRELPFFSSCLLSCMLVFLSEIGDKTWLSTLLLTSKIENGIHAHTSAGTEILIILVGTNAAAALLAYMSSIIARYTVYFFTVPSYVVLYISNTMCILFGIHMLYDTWASDSGNNNHNSNNVHDRNTEIHEEKNENGSINGPNTENRNNTNGYNTRSKKSPPNPVINHVDVQHNHNGANHCADKNHDSHDNNSCRSHSDNNKSSSEVNHRNNHHDCDAHDVTNNTPCNSNQCYKTNHNTHDTKTNDGNRSYILSLLLKTFFVSLVTELGDRSQLSMLVLSAHEHVHVNGILLGGVCGHILCTLLAILIARTCSHTRYLSPKFIATVGGVLFIVTATLSF